ncbi:MAG: hypothetical protein JNM93_13055 [Bacteriovoracaceae bacterium]|nr:hypothetical protein [Bacteriovoracaceae bacterium]
MDLQQHNVSKKNYLSVDEILAQKPLFKTKSEYFQYAEIQMNLLAKKYSLSIEKLIEKAESSHEDNPDFFIVINYARAIYWSKK